MKTVQPPAEDQMLRRLRPALMAFFLRRVRNHSEAEDLTQDVFVRVVNIGLGERSDAYVFQVAQNLLIDRSRKGIVRERYRDAIRYEADRETDSLDPHRLAESREQLKVLIAALTELPERTRTMFILFRMENMSQDAIGASFGISASAVKQHIAKAMAALTRKLRDGR